jgi:hypothetical protein
MDSTMNLRDLIDLFRIDVDDTVEPFLFGEDEAIEYANDAQNEAARRSRLLLDSTTTAIANIDVVAATGLYELDPRVLFIRKARFANKQPLRRMNMQDMETRDPYWEDANASEPMYFISDYETGKIRLHPTPSESGTLLLTVVRDPLAEMNDIDDVPEIPARYHRSLRFWMAFRAYSKQDAEANDPKKAIDSLSMFEQEFGKKSAAIDETWINREQQEGDGTY